MQQRWPLIIADYRREYGMSGDDIAGLDLHEFLWLLQGLSDRSRFVKAWQDKPQRLYDQADIDAVTAAARR